MIDNIKAHIDTLFADAPPTRRVKEAREELLAGCLDKYSDLIASGQTPEQAYDAVVSGIGDVDELLRTITEMDTIHPTEFKSHRQKRALFISGGIFLYVFALAICVIVDEYVSSNLGGAVFLLMCGVATFVLVYGILSTRTKVETSTDTMTEKIRQEMVSGTRNVSLLKAITSSMWSLIALLYLAMGLLLGWWHPGWLIFPLGSVFQNIIHLVFAHPDKRPALFKGLIWSASLVLYLFLSFLTGRWDITWLIFLLALGVTQILNLIHVWRHSE